MGALLRLIVVVALSLLPLGALAQPASAPPPSGLYEHWSPLRMAPVGRLLVSPGALPRWLSVVTTGSDCVVTFEPDQRVVWRVRYGPHGPIEKVTLVDGERYTTTTFDYDPRGHLARKTVVGPGVVGGLQLSDYVTEPSTGRVLRRTERLARRHSWGSRNLPAGDVAARWEVRWQPGGVASTQQFVDGSLVRSDAFDREGRLLRSSFYADEPSPGGVRRRGPFVELVYVRTRAGALERVERMARGRRSRADFRVRFARSPYDTLTLFSGNLVERHEVLLALGSPSRASDEDRGVERRLTDDYAPECVLNQATALEYDATGLLRAHFAACICGYCVAAEQPFVAPVVTAMDLHWTAGPWVRLDGAVDVTADHRVMTPEGPRPAGELVAGQLVLDAEGRPRSLRSVERLPVGPERLGRNVRTPQGVFSAGGILFESEAPRVCPP